MNGYDNERVQTVLLMEGSVGVSSLKIRVWSR